MPMGNPADFVERSDMAVQEKLQALTRIEADHGIARPGQNINEPVDRDRSDLPGSPIHLGFLAAQKHKLEERHDALLAELRRGLLDRPVAARVAVTAKPIQDLDGHEAGCRLVPFGDQPLVGSDDRGLPGLFGRLAPEDPGDRSPSHPQLLGDLAHRQPLDFPEPPNLDLECLVHHSQDNAGRAPCISRLVSYPPSSRRKCIIIYAPEEDLVLYHFPSEAARDEKNHFKQRLFWGYLVLYHRPDHRFPSGPPLLDIGIPAAEIAGVAFRPAVLSQDLARLPAGFPTTGLLALPDSGIRSKIPPTEITSFDHPRPPEQKQRRPL